MTRSWEAQACAAAIRIGFPRKDEKARQKMLDAAQQGGRARYRVPFWLPLHIRPGCRFYKGMPVYMIKPDTVLQDAFWQELPVLGELHHQLENVKTMPAAWPAGDITVLYLHGGAYTKEFLPFHWRFTDMLAVRLGVTVIAPDYPLAPESCCAKSLPLVKELYLRYVKAHPEKKMFLMGDSAGGGMALALSMLLRDEEKRSPDGLILLSPWVDVTMSNPAIPDLESSDPMQRSEEDRAYGSWWAGDLDRRDPRVSPLYGSMDNLPDSLVFTGTDEIIRPDVLICVDRMQQAGTQVQLVTGDGMNHAYPLYPIPEAKEAFRIMTDWMMRKAGMTDES